MPIRDQSAVPMSSFPPRPTTQPPRFFLWVDGVGGYLVCPGSPVTVGQAVAGNPVDVPLMADLSRRHASIVREAEHHLLIPQATTHVSGKRVDGPTTIREGDLLQFGDSVELRFRRPHPLSTTARLDFVSHHRTSPSADGVLLLGNSLLLGPDGRNHVICPQWTEPLMLVRRGQGLFCRATGTVQVDGRPVEGEVAIGLDSRIVSDEFCLSLERIE